MNCFASLNSMFNSVLRFSAYILSILALLMLFSLFIGTLQSTSKVLNTVKNVICVMNQCSIAVEDSIDYLNIVAEVKNNTDGLIQYDFYEIRYWRSIDGSVTALRFQDSSDKELMSIGDLISRYGIPCSVTITEENFNLQYPDFFASTLIVYNPNNPKTLYTTVTPFMPIRAIELYFPTIPCDTPITFPTSYNIVSAWHGFKSLDFYISHRTRP